LPIFYFYFYSKSNPSIIQEAIHIDSNADSADKLAYLQLKESILKC